MKEGKLTVYKANDLIEASYSAISLQEQLMLLACIGSVDPRELTAETRVELTVSDFAGLLDLSARGAYDDLQRAAERLFGRYLVIDQPDPKNPRLVRTRTRWVHAIDYYPGDGKVVLFFAPKVIPYLSQLKERFTKYKLQHVAQFRSTYGVRLYELLMQWQGKGSREIELDWLREKWGLEDKYKALKDLKRRVIEPAMRDINTYSNLWVKMEQRKRGRRVVALQFSFGLKEQKGRKNGRKKEQDLRALAEQIARPGESWESAMARAASLRKKGAENRP